jgi:hypothetical protein
MDSKWKEKPPIGNGGILSIKVKDGKVELSANATIDVCLLYPSGNEELVSLKPDVKEKRRASSRSS